MLQPKIIAMSGRKSAGKNTVAKFIAEWFVKKYDGKTNQYSARDDVKEFSFADNLKQFCIETLGFTYEQCYGTDEQKNQPTHYKWDNLHKHLRWKFGPKQFIDDDDNIIRVPLEKCLKSEDWVDTYYHKSMYLQPIGFREGYMSARDAMQLFGTELIRDTFGNVWADATVRNIKRHNKLLSIITDNRFPNEVETILKEPNAYVIRLTRNPFGSDCHQSEIALDNFDWKRERCFLIDNQGMSIEEQKHCVGNILEQIFSGDVCNGLS